MGPINLHSDGIADAISNCYSDTILVTISDAIHNCTKATSEAISKSVPKSNSNHSHRSILLQKAGFGSGFVKQSASISAVGT
jgi:hypothetical protein